MKHLTVAFALAGGLLLLPVAGAVPYTVTINTTPLSGTTAQLALDFIDGDGVLPSNSISITSFTTDGTLGAEVTVGGVSGTLPGPVTLTDTDAFNEYLIDIILGNSITFVFTATENGGAPPDAFSAFLLDPTTGQPLFTTTHPSPGANALFQFDIDGSEAGLLSVYSAPGGEVGISVTPQGVPVPGTALLLATGMLAFFGRKGRASLPAPIDR